MSKSLFTSIIYFFCIVLNIIFLLYIMYFINFDFLNIEIRFLPQSLFFERSHALFLIILPPSW
uniref:Putative ovule protein n=1 Tax=Solanum chacoense TaxID=4108 RepID=A0A0V0IJT7_SOLCH